MAKVSTGILVYRRRANGIEVLLVHPGGPFWAKKDAGAWTIPKGEPGPHEDLLAAARREFAEELGTTPPPGRFDQLAPVTQKGGKVVHAWAVEGDFDTSTMVSNSFRLEWPPRSGRHIQVPEVDRAQFFDLETARTMINPAQSAFLDQLSALVNPGGT
jgi:predicted NUDIX family NTP pyrophosphohydrolase